MKVARWFLAHSKATDDADINFWVRSLQNTLTTESWEAEVVAGRDDYNARAKAVGGWKAWCKDVPLAETFEGGPLYHGIIVPVIDDLNPTVAKATSDLIDGFLSQEKYVYTWNPGSGEFKRCTTTEIIEGENWTAWARLDLSASA
tara:strand:+ start:1953 stop:2387 length:435 start_codon:yes stop_codon:yes gene_type:complete